MKTSATSGTGWLDLFREGRAPLTVALTLGIWLHAADSLLVVTTLPSAVAQIGGEAWVSWAYSLYMLASILVGASTGLLALTLDLRTAFATAGAFFAFGCVISALAPDMATMLVGRFVQGMGGGGQVALVFVALDRLFPNAMMPKLVALTSAAWSVSAFCGPLVGGLFANYGMWRGAYWAFALQAVLFVVLVLYAVPREPRTRTGGGADRPPLLRLALLAGGVLLVSAAAADPDPLLAPIMIGAAAVMLGLFLARDRARRRNALLPPRPFTPRTAYGAGLLMALTLAAATTTLFTYGPFFLESLAGLTPLTTGYLIAAESIAWGVCAVAIANAGPLAERWLIRGGPMIVTVGIAGTAIFMPRGEILAMIPFILMLGAGFGLMWGFAIKRVTASAPEGERERASAALPTVQMFGYALGAAAVGILANALGFADRPDHDTQRTIAFWIFAAFVPLALVGCWAAWRLSGDWPEPERPSRNPPA